MRELVARLRRFNRFHTRITGLLDKALPGGPLGLAQARVLYELAAAPGTSATMLVRELGMDKAQASRILAGLVRQGLVRRDPGHLGRRAKPLNPTDKGLEVLAAMERASDLKAEQLAGHLDKAGQERLTLALAEVETLLDPDCRTAAPALRVRPARPGDMGRIAARHADIYGREHGFGPEFEEYVLLGLAEYLQAPDRNRSRVWIGETDGEPAGSVAVVARPDNQAQLRWLLVEPKARRWGLGRALAQTAVDFARDKGFDSLYLWTLGILAPARSLYTSLGFSLAEEINGTMGGKPMKEEHWRLNL